MFGIRFHGRGGQGMKTASRILGTAFFKAGYEVQDAPRYGAERLFRSDDRGESWRYVQTPIRSGPASGIFSIVFTDPDHGVAVGGTYANPHDASANVCITQDGGKTWRQLSPERRPRVKRGEAGFARAR